MAGAQNVTPIRLETESSDPRYCPVCDIELSASECGQCGTRTYTLVRPVPEPDPLLGTTLDERYTLDSLIGRGGMGAVYRATNLAVGNTVAIKVLRPDLSHDLDTVKRFHREARNASQLSHPHTVRVFDFGQSRQGLLYMVLEYLNGRTLHDRLDDGPVPALEVARLIEQIAQSLAEAHSQHLAHRDLKPENVMLVEAAGSEGFAKVLDFGVARVLTDRETQRVTSTGLIVGTPHYMAPEQAQAKAAITPAVDIYALGVMCWELLSGVVPYDGDDAMTILLQHIQADVPPLPDDVDCPEWMEALVYRMMAKDPSRRPNVGEILVLVRQMSRLDTGPRPAAAMPELLRAASAPPTGHHKPVGHWLLAAAVLLLVLVAAGWTWLAPSSTAATRPNDGSAPAPPRPVAEYEVQFPESNTVPRRRPRMDIQRAAPLHTPVSRSTVEPMTPRRPRSGLAKATPQRTRRTKPLRRRRKPASRTAHTAPKVRPKPSPKPADYERLTLDQVPTPQPTGYERLELPSAKNTEGGR